MLLDILLQSCHPKLDMYPDKEDLQESINYHKQALTVFRAIRGDAPHPDVANSLNDISLIYDNLGKTQKGITY